MSFLTPLYIAGLAAISLPILLHLIRRAPRGSVSFSSLMFITPTPPRLTRRSRLDQILLLILRGLVICLLALAFARPFWRQIAAVDQADVGRRWVALLVDTSASMQREGTWRRAEQEVGNALKDLAANDLVALYAYDHQIRRLVSFEESRAAPATERGRLVQSRFDQLKPGWGDSNLGTALIYAADELDAASDEGRNEVRRQVVVISDLQDGSQIEPLQSYEWPASVSLIVRQVSPDKTTNASLQVLDEPTAEQDERGARVRVTNAPDSRTQQFQISWAGDQAGQMWDTLGVSVPPGESRVVRMTKPTVGRTVTHLALSGDDHDFDNRYYVVPAERTETEVVYVGDDDGSDPEHLRYYLERGLTSDPWHQNRITNGDPPRLMALSKDRPSLVVMTRELPSDSVDALRDYLTTGGTALLVVGRGAGVLKTLALVTGQTVGDVEEVEPKDYAMLGEIDFQHPVFSPFASPLYNDFTKIYFWRYRRLSAESMGEATVIARFDTGDPALIECRQGQGRLYVLTAGWQPEESQLARSTKFVPLLSRFVYRDAPGHGDRYVVNESVALPPGPRGELATVTRPDGTEVPLETGQVSFDETGQPGVYRIHVGADEQRFAVNLPVSETRTAPLDVAQLEQRGVRLGSALTRAEEIETLRQMRDMELESRQSYWQWLIAAALIVLIVETVVAARQARGGAGGTEYPAVEAA